MVIMTITRTTSTILALLLVTCQGHPQSLYFHQHQQQQHQQIPASFYYQQHQPGSGYYGPGPGAAKIASVVVQQSSAGPIGGEASHYVIVYPPAGEAVAQHPAYRQQPFVLAGPGPSVVLREEGVGEAPDAPPPTPISWWTSIYNIFAPSNTNTQVVSPVTQEPVVAQVEETTTEATAAVPDENKPEKVVAEMMEAVEQNLPVDSDAKRGALETLDEVPDTPGDSKPEGVDKSVGGGGVGGVDTLVRVDGNVQRLYTPAHAPQFYGNYGNIHQLAAAGGPVATFLLGRSPEIAQTPQLLQFPLHPATHYQYQPQPFAKHLPIVPALAAGETAGAAAIEFQKTLQAAKLTAGQDNSVVPAVAGQRSATIPGSEHVDISQNLDKFLAQAHTSQAVQQQESLPGLDASIPQGLDLQALQNAQNHPGLINVGPGYQNVYYLLSKKTAEQSQAVTVEAQNANKDKVDDDDKIHPIEEQAGPSVAQAKPQAIAIAGVGGTAAATPVATALVGPGGLAVAAPTGTAVAGQTGGGMLTGPAAAAVNKYLTLTGGKKNDGFVAYGTAV